MTQLPLSLRQIAESIDVRQYRILLAVDRQVRIDYIRDLTSPNAPVRKAHDAMLEQDLIGWTGKAYLLTEAGRAVMDAATAGPLARIVRVEDELKTHTHMLFHVVLDGTIALHHNPTSIYRRLHLDAQAYDAVPETIGGRTIEVDTEVYHKRGERRSCRRVVVLADYTRPLPTGDVLHELFGLVFAGGAHIGRFYAMKSLLDDIWITADTERAVRLRFKKHVPVPTEPELPTPRTAEDIIEDAALWGGF